MFGFTSRTEDGTHGAEAPCFDGQLPAFYSAATLADLEGRAQ